MIRSFIAFPVSSEIKNTILDIQEEIKKLNKQAPVKWVDRGGIHVTIEFLGDLEDRQIAKVKQILGNIVPYYPVFNYGLKYLNAFPNIVRPNVLVVSLSDKDQVGFSLYSAIHRALQEDGLDQNNRPWQPHLTLGRVRGSWKPEGFRKIEIPKKLWPADKVVLYKSELAPAGAIYTPLAEYKLEAKK